MGNRPAQAAPTTSSQQLGRLSLFVGVVSSAASVSLYATAHQIADGFRHDPRIILTFVGVTLVLQALSVDAYGRGSISVSGIGLLATGFVFGVGPAMATGLLVALVHAARRRPKLHKVIFNAATFVLSTGAAVALYDVLGGPRGSATDRLVAAQLAAAAFLAVNIVLLSLAMSLAESVSPFDVWKERLRWLTVHYLAFGPLALASVVAYEKVGLLGLIAFTLPPALTMLSVRMYLTRTREAVEQLRDANRDLVEANEQLSALAEQVRKTHRDTIAALSRSMEAKDLYTGGHTERVASISVALARELGFTGEELEAIEIGALLHDIGKIGVPESILHKPGPLNEDEWKIMKQHPIMCDSILSTVDLHPFVQQTARSSHERMDGWGYPDGLLGEQIPLAARIVFVADAFDAITTDRPYRRAQGLAAALAEIREHSGTQFCPRVVAALEQIAAESPEVLTVKPRLVATAA